MKQALVGVICLAMTACGTLTGSDEPSYKQSRSVPPLEVPPDLASPAQRETYDVPEESGQAATYSGYQRQVPEGGRERAAVLPDSPIAEVKRDADKRWLVVEAPPEDVWVKARNFLLDQGFEIEQEEPKAGVLETGWAEQRAVVKAGGIGDAFSRALGKVYSADTRDKFRLRLERGPEAGTTELFLTHYGLKEVAHGSNADVIETSWEVRPTDPELEAIMLRRLMVFLGSDKDEAERRVAQAEEAAPQAHLRETDEGIPYLGLDKPFATAWRVTGIALDRVGFTVEDRDRTQGIYFVRYHPPEGEKEAGFLAGLFGGDDSEEPDRYQVQIEETDAGARIMVRDLEGKPSESETARRILSLLHTELK